MEYGYYGRHFDCKPKVGVHYFMIEEYVKSIINRATSEFKNELEEFMKNYKKEIKNEVKKINKKLESQEVSFNKKLMKIEKDKEKFISEMQSLHIS